LKPRRRALTLYDKAVLNVELKVATFATSERKVRMRHDRRLIEAAHMIKKTFEPIIMTSLFPRSQIDIFIQVLQIDGGKNEF